MPVRRATFLIILILAPALALAFVYVPARGTNNKVTALAARQGPGPQLATDAEGDLLVAHGDHLAAQLLDNLELWSVPYAAPRRCVGVVAADDLAIALVDEGDGQVVGDRKSTRLNSSH